jgi:excisionase family DNA binding protein
VTTVFLKIVVRQNPTMNIDSELLTLEEARRVLRFSKSKLYSERRSGRLPSRRFGRRAVLIHRQDLDQYIQAASTSQEPK